MAASDSSSEAGSVSLTREAIVGAFAALDRELEARGATAEICLFGGTVMVLAFAARTSTKDVDAIFQPAALVRELARRVAESSGLPADWLNDGVKVWISARHDTTAGNLPQFRSVRLTMPTPEYLLAMKCMAARIGSTVEGADDTADIVFLIRHLGLSTPKAVMEIVSTYYPPDRIPAKTQFLVESLFEEGRA